MELIKVSNVAMMMKMLRRMATQLFYYAKNGFWVNSTNNRGCGLV